jgi:uncharacterized membrane protein YbaN (DUF454 family)
MKWALPTTSKRTDVSGARFQHTRLNKDEALLTCRAARPALLLSARLYGFFCMPSRSFQINKTGPRLKQLAYRGLAYLSLGLAILGVILPGLPATEFLLLAAWASARGSPRLHRWLQQHPLFGSMLRDWHSGHVARRSKWFASLSMLLCFALLLWHQPRCRHGLWGTLVVVKNRAGQTNLSRLSGQAPSQTVSLRSVRPRPSTCCIRCTAVSRGPLQSDLKPAPAD